MDRTSRKLRRNQLDKFFENSQKVLSSGFPKKGWIRGIRESLGMTMEELGTRMGVIRQRVERIEADETSGNLTLKTMRSAAEALNCDFVYFIVPKSSLKETVEAQAKIYAETVFAKTQHTMRLEKQALKKEGRAELLKTLQEEALLHHQRKIWKVK